MDYQYRVHLARVEVWKQDYVVIYVEWCLSIESHKLALDMLELISTHVDQWIFPDNGFG